MDTGIVASRYAKALLRFSDQQQEERQVYAEMQQLLKTILQLPHFHSQYLANPALTASQKEELMKRAISPQGESLSKSTVRFLQLLQENKRSNILPFVASSFVHQYEQKHSIVLAKLSTAVPVSSDTAKRISAIVAQRTDTTNIELECIVDERLGAGFVLQYQDKRIDASLRRQFEDLSRQFK